MKFCYNIKKRCGFLELLYGSIRMTYLNLEPRTITWSLWTKIWKLQKIIQLLYNESCTLKIKYANMHMDRRSRKIIVEYVEFQFDGKKIEDFELRFLTNRVRDWKSNWWIQMWTCFLIVIKRIHLINSSYWATELRINTLLIFIVFFFSYIYIFLSLQFFLQVFSTQMQIIVFL